MFFKTLVADYNNFTGCRILSLSQYHSRYTNQEFLHFINRIKVSSMLLMILWNKLTYLILKWVKWLYCQGSVALGTQKYSLLQKGLFIMFYETHYLGYLMWSKTYLTFSMYKKTNDDHWMTTRNKRWTQSVYISK